ncbi:MAG: ABC transporter permease [Candidatus Woesearchaeota archaeon]|nr:ABC transporter permease [Candidatus Woesearchaeota archaeon]
MLKDYAIFAWRSLEKRRLRSWLTMIGIFIGIAAVISLISLGQGVKAVVEEQFQMLGTDKLLISPGAGFASSLVQGSSSLTDTDLETVKRSGGIDVAGGFSYKIGSIQFRRETKYTWIMGMPMDESTKIIEQMQNVRVHEGRSLREDDTNKAFIGILLSKDNEFFAKGIQVGDKIKLDGREFDVVGIMESVGNPQDDSSLWIPLDEARALFNETDSLSMIIASVKEGESPEKIAESLKNELRRSKGQKRGDEDFTIQTAAEIMDAFNAIFNAIQFVLIGIAAISLLVGGIGIMNTMYTSVLERTRDIGIMKAVGAKNSDILTIFIVESGILGFFGGAIGILIGMGITKIIERLAFVFLKTNMLVARFSSSLIIGALAFSIIIGIVSGMVPSIQASKMKVTQSIRFRL